MLRCRQSKNGVDFLELSRQASSSGFFDTLHHLVSERGIVDMCAERQQGIEYMAAADGMIQCLGEGNGFITEVLMLCSRQCIGFARRKSWHRRSCI